MNHKLFFLTFLFLIGCAWGDRKVVLNYSSVMPSQPKNNITIRVDTFEDKRTITDTVGYSRNAYGMRCAKVLPQNSVTDWVKNALKTELINAGYSVTDEDSVANIIKGVVFDVFCDTYFTYDGSIGIKAVLIREGEELFDKNYTAKKSGGVNWAATSTSFAKTLELTLQDVIRQVIFDVNKALLEDSWR